MNKYSKKSSGPGIKKMADGGSVGLFERLRAGNIDDPSSEAYKRWGAGSKAKVESTDVTSAQATAPAPVDAPASAAPEMRDASSDYDDSDARVSSAAPSPSPSPAPVPRRAAPRPKAKAPAPKATSKPDSMDDVRARAMAQVNSAAKDADDRATALRTSREPKKEKPGFLSAMLARTSKERGYVDGGQIGRVETHGAGTQTYKKQPLSGGVTSPHGGGRASYGKK